MDEGFFGKCQMKNGTNIQKNNSNERGHQSLLHASHGMLLLLLLLVAPTQAAIYQFQRPFHDYVNLTEGQVFSIPE